MIDPVHKFVIDLWDTQNPIRRHCMTILRGKRNRLEIMQEISINLLQNYTRTSRIIEDGDENIELYTYKMANLMRTWKVSIDKNPVWARNLDRDVPNLDLYRYHEEPDLFGEIKVLFLEKGVHERDQDIFFKHWREEHSEIYISFKMELSLSYVLKSLRVTLKLVRAYLNPTWKTTSNSGKWQVGANRPGPKQTPQSIAKQIETKKNLPKITCPKCKRRLLYGMYEKYSHGPNCTKTPIDPNYVPNAARSKAQRGVKKATGTCPNCGKTMSKSNLSRFHGQNGEKCKIKQINN
jgi:hypothetical protein